jgi:hypothetical protein
LLFIDFLVRDDTVLVTTRFRVSFALR